MFMMLLLRRYCPGFSASVIGRDIVTPLDLEQIFGLPKVRLGCPHFAAWRKRLSFSVGVLDRTGLILTLKLWVGSIAFDASSVAFAPAVQGNIMSGRGMTLSQLGYARPVPGYSNYRTPLQGLYMAGAGTHPGGGVSGAPGRNCAMAVLSDLQPIGSFFA